MSHEEWFEDCSQAHDYGDGIAIEKGGIWHEICNECGEDMDDDRIASDICDKCFYKLVTFENCLKAGADKNFKDDDYKYNAFIEWMYDPDELVDTLAKDLKETLEQEKHFSGERWTEKAMREWAGNNADELVEFLTE